MSYCGKEGIIKKHIVSLVLLLIMGFISCYDGLQDVYEEGRVYNLRDRGPAGGWIFYINPNYKADGWRYLEAAPEDQSTSQVWISGGATQTTLNGKTSASIGSGKANTEVIIAQAGHTGSAAKVCRDYRGGGYDDWFLPSKEELLEICWVLHSRKFDTIDNPAYGSNRVGGFAEIQWYWSSSEFNTSNGSSQYFGNGSSEYENKNGTAYVRAVRAF